MSPIYVQVILLVGGTGLSLWAHVWVIRWARREDFPYSLEKKLSEQIEDLAKQLVLVRGQVKYIEGRLNGKHWRNE